jgi:tetratricopeptide (TPR) repeat protein
MCKASLAVFAAVLGAATAVAAEEPPYKRVLQGEDAKKAEALSRRMDELWSTAKFAEAVAPAEELLALRQRVQGKDHWEAADAARLVETLRKAAGLPAATRAALAEAPATAAKAYELYQKGKYAQAEALYRKALAMRQEALGPDHPDTALASSNLAASLESQGRVQEAEVLHRRALAVREQVLGSRHPHTAASRNNLAVTLKRQGRLKEAEQLIREALAVRQQVLGPRHPDSAEACGNLAANLDAQGRSKEAEPLHRQALAVKEEVLGPKHPGTAISYTNLAYNLDAQGRAREAEPLLRKALAIKEEVLGSKHPDMAFGYNNLASNLHVQGRLKEAESFFRQALAAREEGLGSKHPDTALSYNNLAVNLAAQGRHQEAEPLYRRALAIKEEVLGPKHPDTAGGYNNLAMNLWSQGRSNEAEPFCRQALAVWLETLGPRHTDTAKGYLNLAINLNAQRRHREAEPLYRQALAVFEEALGPRHPHTAACWDSLAINLEAQGQVAEAERLKRKALAVREQVLGPKHPDTARSCTGLAYTLERQGKATEAEALYRRALATQTETLGPRHPHTANTCNNLAFNLQAQGRAKEAEPFFRQALAAREEVLGPQHPHTALSYHNLANNLQIQGRFEEAEPLWQKGADGIEAARLRLTSSALDKASVGPQPHFGLADCRLRLKRPVDAWAAAEAGLGRGLLDDLAARTAAPPEAAAERRARERTTRLAALNQLLVPLLTAEKLDKPRQGRRDDLLKERAKLDEEIAREAAEVSQKALLSLDRIQEGLPADTALVFWLDFLAAKGQWGCVVRRLGPPAWVQLPGSGRDKVWTDADDHLSRQLRDDLGRPDSGAEATARRLAAQRIDPLAPHLAATGELPAVRRLVVVPVGRMAGIPVEVLTDRYLVSYAPSATVFARLAQKHRPLEAPTLLALGDPSFALPGATPPEPPKDGLYLTVVLPGGNAARRGLRAGDVLLRYGGARLTSRADLKIAEGGEPVPIEVWRDGKTLDDLRLAPGKLGVVISDDPPAVALRKRHELDLLADTRSRSEVAPLPGTRLEVAAVAGLLPPDRARILVGSQASEQELGALAGSGKLKEFRLLHLATHGTVDPVSAAHSALELARDRLPPPEEQARLTAAGKKPPTGRLSVETIAKEWELDADLVVLSACQTALGPDGGGEGLLGFSQVLLGKGARSLVLSLWRVDDTATALLMTRFYANLLGKREGLKGPLPKAEALAEAKQWLRTRPRAEVEKLASRLAEGEVRGPQEPKPPRPQPALPKRAGPPDAAPFAHPYYWAAFILIGDPD